MGASSLAARVKMEEEKEGGRAKLSRLADLLADEWLEDVEHLVLLTPRQLGNCIEELAGTSARPGNAGGLGLAQQLFHRDPEGLCHGSQDIGTWDLPGSLPVPNIGMVLVNLAG